MFNHNRLKTKVMDKGGWHWIVARTRVSNERYAALNLERSGYEWYLPMAAREDSKDKLFPLFRSYIFVRTFNNQFYDLMSTWGIASVIRQGLSPAHCPDEIVNKLKKLEKDNGAVLLRDPSKIKNGSPVKIKYGHLAGKTGLLLSTSGEDRARVLMTILGVGATIKTKYSSLEAA